MTAERGKAERRILINASALSITEGLAQLANFGFVISFARTFGATQMAYYSVAMAVGAIAALFFTLGTPGLMVREFSRDPSCVPEWLGVLIPVQGLLAVLAWLLATGTTVLLIGDLQAITVASAVCAYQILLRLAMVINTPLVASERMVRLSAANVAYRAVTLVMALTAIHLGVSAGWVSWIFFSGSAIYLAFAWYQSSRFFGRTTFRLAPREALRLFKLSAPFFSIAAFAVLYGRGAVVMLSAMASPHAVGLYAAADRIMIAVGLAPTMLNSAVYPALTRVAARSRAEVRALCGRAALLMLAVTLPLAGLFTVFSSRLVLLLFGPSYGEAARVLQILTWTLPVVGLQSLFGSQLIAVSQQRALAGARFSGLALFALLSPVLIWSLGIRGAAWAVLASDTALSVYYFTILRKTDATPTFGAQSAQAQ